MGGVDVGAGGGRAALHHRDELHARTLRLRLRDLPLIPRGTRVLW